VSGDPPPEGCLSTGAQRATATAQPLGMKDDAALLESTEPSSQTGQPLLLALGQMKNVWAEVHRLL
jgi:hypothetical protein